MSKEKKERPGWERGWVVNTALQSDTHFPKKYFQCLLQWRKHLKIGMVSSVNDIPMQIKLHHSLQMTKLTVGNLITLGLLVRWVSNWVNITLQMAGPNQLVRWSGLQWWQGEGLQKDLLVWASSFISDKLEQISQSWDVRVTSENVRLVLQIYMHLMYKWAQGTIRCP